MPNSERTLNFFMTPDTRTNLIKAAEAVVRTKGVSSLTLSEVAKAAGVSKGGLLYHFPTKDALVEAMLDYALKSFEAAVSRASSKDESPGAWIRAYIKATFSSPGTKLYEESMSASFLIASVALNPSLLKAYASHMERWSERVTHDGIDSNTAQILRLAADGLWLNEALGLRPLSAAQRKQVIESMLDVANRAASAGP